MSYRIWKAIGIGVLAGAAVFFAPFFFFRALIVILIIGLLFRVFGRRRWLGGYGFCHNPAYGRRWQSMTPEERKSFREKMEKEFFKEQQSSSPSE